MKFTELIPAPLTRCTRWLVLCNSLRSLKLFGKGQPLLAGDWMNHLSPNLNQTNQVGKSNCYEAFSVTLCSPFNEEMLSISDVMLCINAIAAFTLTSQLPLLLSSHLNHARSCQCFLTVRWLVRTALVWPEAHNLKPGKMDAPKPINRFYFKHLTDTFCIKMEPTDWF